MTSRCAVSSFSIALPISQSISTHVYPTNRPEILKRLILQEESSIGQISLLQLERGARDREQRSLHTHTRHSSLVESLQSLGLEDLHEHIEELHLHLVALLGLHARLDHVHRRHQARGEASSNHTRSQQTAKRHVAVFVTQRDLDGRVEREEDHGVGDITKKRNRGALVHATQTQVTAHYTLEKRRREVPARRPVRCSGGSVAWTCMRILVISMGLVAITWQKPAPGCEA